MATLGEFPADILVGSVDTTNGMLIELSVELDSVTPKSIWETKDKWQKAAEDSREIWNSMDNEKQEAIIRMTAGTLERLYDKIPEWIPDGLRGEPGETVDVTFKIIYTDIDAEIARHEEATSFQIAESSKRLVETVFNDED